MSYFTAPQRRMCCERLIDGKWTAVRDNEEIVFRDEELNSFNDPCTNELYNISSVWADCETARWTNMQMAGQLKIWWQC